MLGAGYPEVDVRKRLVSAGDPKVVAPEGDWLDLERMAQVELTSEDPQFPIEHALGAKETTGWRASETGPQVIRLLFDKPQSIHRIQLHFVDGASERAQEFAVFAQAGDTMREMLRQQWNFSPQGATEELEDHKVDWKDVTALELRIDPDRSHDPKQSRHVASLERLRLA
jgi:hypothetical protein